MKTSDWYQCYSESWQGVICPDAFAHPAKFSRALIRRIYEHLLEEGWLQAGDTVLDPFGGVAIGAWPALRLGLNWLGVELEQKFVDLGNQNIALWNERYSQHLPRWGRAVLLQGDSRRLGEVVRQVGAMVSSPPYIESLASDDPDRRGGLFRDPKRRNDKTLTAEYGTHPAQLGNMPEGSLADALDAVVSIPPYAGTAVEKNSDGIDLQKQYETYRASGGRQSWESFRRTQELHSQGYGRSEGQLAAMPEGAFDACLSSPPWENSITGGNDGRIDETAKDIPSRKNAGPLNKDYGNSLGQLGIEQGDTFWSAARAIVQQVWQVLAPGAPAVWVVKSFVRNKRRVDFPNQWRELCEACGFESLHWHRAHLVEDRGSQFDLFGELHENRIERKSFFRRLAERKGSPRIDWEIVLCTRKPA